MARTFSYAVKVLFAMGVVAITACSHHGAGLGGGVLPETSAVSNVHTLTALADGNSAALIDRRVSVEDRRVLQQFMDGTHAIGATRRTLQNTNIVLYDSVAGKFISNKPSLANSFRLIKKNVTDRTRQALSLRGALYYQDTEFRNSGPYRRIISKPRATPTSPLAPFSSGIADLICGNTKSVLKSGVAEDQGDIMLGGWSGDSYPSAVDAGLQYNYNSYTHPADDYQMFIAIARNGSSAHPGTDLGYSNGFYAVSGSAYDFACGPTMQLTYSVSPIGSSQLALVLSATSIAPGSASYYFGYIYSPGDSLAYGWDLNCIQCIMKHETSIAQSSDDMGNGDQFQVDWSGEQISCGWETGQTACGSQDLEPWTSINTGSCSEYPNWSTFVAGLRDCTNMPTTPSNPDVQVSGFNWTGETDHIALTTPLGGAPAPGYGSWGPFIGPTSVSGLQYATNAQLGSGNFQTSLNLINNNNYDISIELPSGPCSVTWNVTATTSTGATISLQQPAAGARCEQSVSWALAPANTKGSNISDGTWLGVGSLTKVSYTVSVPSLGIYQSNTLTSQTASFTASSGQLYVGATPAPTPTPDPTPKPCIRQPCPQ